MKKLLLIFIYILLPLLLFSQQYTGTWTSHLPYNKSSILTVAKEKVFCATEGGLFYFNIEDQSINKFSREDGLSDADISTIKYSETTDGLLIAYTNANLDLIIGNEIYNIPDIKRKQILGDKTIYNIHFSGKLAYLSCGFGIIVLDTEKREIKETYYIGSQGSQIKVNEVTTFGNHLYAGTDEGLYYASLSSPNLADYNNWKISPRFSQSYQNITSVVSTSEEVYLAMDNQLTESDSIYVLKNGNWELFDIFQTSLVRSLNVANNKLLISSLYHVNLYTSGTTMIKKTLIGEPEFADMDSEGTLWVSDNVSGLFRVLTDEEPVQIIPNGPEDINTSSLFYKNGTLLGTAGGTTGSWNNLFRQGLIHKYQNNNWSSIRIDSLKDLLEIEIDPDDNNHFFIASWGYGLLEYQDEELINHFTDVNSSLQSIIPGDYYYRLGGLIYDQQKNLWVTNSGVVKPLSVYTSGGEWISYSVGSAVNGLNMADMIITDQGHKWIILQGGNGLLVFNDNGTLENPDDDEMIKLSVVDENNKVITNEIYSIALDRDGNIWLGTNQGIVVYYSPYRIFTDDEFYARQIIVPRNDGSGYGDALLSTESITAIEVDGANRKWIGTQDGGVFLVSDDGLEQIHSFNTENSPLLSNSITDIAINDDNGEVFIGTSKGIISYVSDATEPSGVFSDVYAFPNPVREDYQGDIIISGLVENTIVKITDLNANLVYETRSLGGQAVWDGTNLLNQRVATGVYLIFCASEDGLQSHVTKLLFIH